MKTAERVVMVILFLCLAGGGSWIYFAVKHNQKEVREAVARGEYEQPKDSKTKEIAREDWKQVYPATVVVTIGDVDVFASVADSMSERIKGLSDTPFLPDNVVKLFAFGSPGEHSIWMKDMNYTIDILWADEDGSIVHIEEKVSPDTYPDSFSSPTPAWYVVEASEGFVEKNNIKLGDKVSVVR